MRRILLLNCGPHGQTSHGYRLAMQAITTFDTNVVQITERDLIADPIPPIGRDYALAITSKTSNDAQQFAWSERLIVELEQHDMLFIVTPLHNFTVPAALKLWIDHVLRIHRSFTPTPEGKVGLLKDRPTFVLVSSGGFHTGERAKQADFLTPYLRYALGSIGIKDVHFLRLQALVFGPEMVALAVEGARQLLSEKLSLVMHGSRISGAPDAPALEAKLVVSR